MPAMFRKLQCWLRGAGYGNCLVLLSITMATAFRAYAWLGGYFILIDPLPFVLLTPIALLTWFAAMVLISLFGLLHACLWAGGSGISRLVRASAFLGALLVGVGFGLWGPFDGFRARVEAIGEQKLRGFALRARELYGDGEGGEAGAPRDPRAGVAYQNLCAEFAFLGIGEPRPIIQVTKQSVAVYWGSGLTGSFWITIYSPGVELLSNEMRDSEEIYPGILIEYE